MRSLDAETMDDGKTRPNNDHSKMDIDRASIILTALSHHQRIAVWSELVPVGRLGLSAGTIAARLKIVPSSLSFHLQVMTRAGLLVARQDGRHTNYSANDALVAEVCRFLTDTVKQPIIPTT